MAGRLKDVQKAQSSWKMWKSCWIRAGILIATFQSRRWWRDLLYHCVSLFKSVKQQQTGIYSRATTGSDFISTNLKFEVWWHPLHWACGNFQTHTKVSMCHSGPMRVQAWSLVSELNAPMTHHNEDHVGALKRWALSWDFLTYVRES